MSELDSIVSLQQTMSELAAARERLDGIPDWMTELHGEYTTRKSEIDAEEAVAEEADRKRREAEADLADNQEKLKHYQSQVSQVTTQREYGALLKEIDTVKDKIKDAEEQAMEAIEGNEAASEKLEELRKEFAELDERYQTELAKWESEKPGVQATANQLEGRISEIEADIPRGVLSLFKRLHARTNGDPLAEVQHMANPKGTSMWHCGACSFNVRPMIAMEVKGGSILHCDSCKRILHWTEEEEAADEAEG